ncbi:MAG: hypothetical protein ACOX5J_04095 [Candidatus Hydrogenedentales bacterium]
MPRRLYRSVGYFGWNSISKRMAMYYMTGDAFHAHEALRLAFSRRKGQGGRSPEIDERTHRKQGSAPRPGPITTTPTTS